MFLLWHEIWTWHARVLGSAQHGGEATNLRWKKKTQRYWEHAVTYLFRFSKWNELFHFDSGFGILISTLHVWGCMQQRDDRVRTPLGATQQPSKQQWSQKDMWYGSPCQHKAHQGSKHVQQFFVSLVIEISESCPTESSFSVVLWFDTSSIVESPSSETEFGHAECCTISGKEDAKKMLVCLLYTQITCPWFEPIKIHLDCRKRKKNNPGNSASDASENLNRRTWKKQTNQFLFS